MTRKKKVIPENKRKPEGKIENIGKPLSSDCKWSSEISVLLGIVSTCLYAFTLYPSIPGGDSGELIAAAYELGVAHPPGYPLFTVLAHCIIRLVPFGSVAWRVNLLAALFGGATALFLSKIVIRLTGSIACASFAVGFWCWCRLTWMWSITAEVFSLNNLFITVVMKLCVDFHYVTGQMKQKVALYGAFICGLSLCNQHTIIIYVAVLILWVLLKLWHNQLLSLVFLLKLGVTFMLGLLPYIYIPLSAHFSNAKWTWGDQRTFDGFLRHLLRFEYGTFDLGKDGVKQEFSKALRLYASHVEDEMSIIVLVLFVAGIVLSLYRLAKVRDEVCCVFVFMMVAYTTFFSWRANLDVTNPLMYGVVERFWMQSDIVVIVISAVALDYLIRAVEDNFEMSDALVGWDILFILTFISLQLYKNFSFCNQSNNTVILEFGEDVMKSFPNGSLVLTKGDLPSNTLRYLYLCENKRPDLLLFDQEVLTYDWSVPMMRNVYPDIKFPGDRMYTQDGLMADGLTTFTFKTFLNANNDRSIYGCIGVQDHESSWKTAYYTMAFGVCSQFLKKGSRFDLSKYVYQTRKIAENWTYPYDSFPITSWERVATNEMWQAKISSAFQLFEKSQETKSPDKKTDYLVASYKLYKSAIKSNKNFPAFWHKNFALVSERMLHLKTPFKMKELVEDVLKHFKAFVKKDPSDPDSSAIQSTIKSMETMHEGLEKVSGDF